MYFKLLIYMVLWQKKPPSGGLWVIPQRSSLCGIIPWLLSPRFPALLHLLAHFFFVLLVAGILIGGEDVP
jgi:hypothetical protein